LTALVVMFLTSCVLGATSIVFKQRSLAYANVALAAIAPILTHSPEPSLVGLMTYLLVLAAGAVWVAWITGWRGLIFLSLIITWLYSAPFVSGWAPDSETGLMLSFLFTTLYLLSSILGLRVAQTVRAADLMTAAVSGLFLLMWVLGVAAHEWQVMILIAWTLVYAVGAFLAVRLGAEVVFFYCYAGVGVVLLGVATSIQLSGPDLTIAAIIEAALILLVGYRITQSARTIPVLALPSIVPILLSIESAGSPAWRTGVWHEDAAVLVLMLLTTAGFAAYFSASRVHASDDDQEILRETGSVLAIMSGLYAMRFLWLAVHALVVSDDIATMLTLLVYILVASILFMAGKQTGLAWQRIVARALIAFVVARLILVDVWSMAVSGRIITFLIIGTVLIVVAWVERSTIQSHVRTDA
jgi:hypothetical protein